MRHLSLSSLSPAFRRGALRSLALLLVLWVGPALATTIQTVRSPGGIEAWLVEDHSVPVVAVQFGLRGGSAYDPANRLGLASLATSLLTEGAGDLDAGAWADRLSALSADISIGAGRDDVTGSLYTLKSSLPDALDLLSLALTRPRFDPAAVERLRAQTLRGIEQRSVDPQSIAYRDWFRLAFGDHPYGRRTEGTPASVKAITVADLKAFVASRLHRDGLIVGVAGDVTPAELGPLLDRAFGALPKGKALPSIPPAHVAPEGGIAVTERPVPQSVVVFGQDGVERSDPDWYAALVLDQVVGGSVFSARLMSAVRVKGGLSYGISTQLLPYRAGGAWIGQVSSRNGKVGEVLDLVRKTWAGLAADGPTPQELDEAKRYLTGSFPLSLDSTNRLAAVLVQMQRDRLPIDYLDRRKALIESVTEADVKKVAKRLMHPERLLFVVVGKPDGVAATRSLPKPG